MDSSNIVRETYRHGQSIWLDHMDRQLIQSGTLKNMIRNEALTTMTSRTTIFEQSIEDTIGTVPLVTLHPFLHHGKVGDTSSFLGNSLYKG